MRIPLSAQTPAGRRTRAALSPVAAAAVGGLGSRRAPEVYNALKKPAWAPPATIFGPVWSGLYGLIGAAGWRMSARPVGRAVWTLHGSQLLLNAAWPWAFFGFARKDVSLSVIAALDVTLAAELSLLWRRDRASAALLAPYLGWCLFASALNYAVQAPADAAEAPAAR